MLGPQEGCLPAGTPCSQSPHLCSWAECHSMSHLTGRTSVESPPAPEGAGRRRRQTICRRIPGPLSCLGLGRQGLRRTRLGRWGREAGPSRCLELSLRAPFSTTHSQVFALLSSWLPLNPGCGEAPHQCCTCLSAALGLPLLSRFKCLLVIISTQRSNITGSSDHRVKINYHPTTQNGFAFLCSFPSSVCPAVWKHVCACKPSVQVLLTLLCSLAILSTYPVFMTL